MYIITLVKRSFIFWIIFKRNHLKSQSKFTNEKNQKKKYTKEIKRKINWQTIVVLVANFSRFCFLWITDVTRQFILFAIFDDAGQTFDCCNRWSIFIDLKIQIISTSYRIWCILVTCATWKDWGKNCQQEKINANNNERAISWNATLQRILDIRFQVLFYSIFFCFCFHCCCWIYSISFGCSVLSSRFCVRLSVCSWRHAK